MIITHPQQPTVGTQILQSPPFQYDSILCLTETTSWIISASSRPWRKPQSAVAFNQKSGEVYLVCKFLNPFQPCCQLRKEGPAQLPKEACTQGASRPPSLPSGVPCFCAQPGDAPLEGLRMVSTSMQIVPPTFRPGWGIHESYKRHSCSDLCCVSHFRIRQITFYR